MTLTPIDVSLLIIACLVLFSVLYDTKRHIIIKTHMLTEYTWKPYYCIFDRYTKKCVYETSDKNDAKIKLRQFNNGESL